MDSPVDVHHARQLLSSISSLEAAEGVPVGVLLIDKKEAGEFKKSFEEKYGSDKKVGFKRVKRIASIEPFIIIHLSARSARDVADHVHQGSSQCSASDDFPPFEYFAGVRMADPVFGFDDILAPLRQESICNRNEQSCQNSHFAFAEVFAGIGGFRLGLEKKLGGTCSFACEIDPAARSTYALNFGSAGLLGDVTDYYAHQFPDHDILTGGFPCQSFSDRGKQKGLDDPRGQLYRELTRILRCKRPKAFLFENVASLLTMTGGKRNRIGESKEDGLILGNTFNTILKAFEDCGYTIFHEIIDARHFLPQTRERVYIVGFRRDLFENLSPTLDFFGPIIEKSKSTESACEATVLDILEDSPDPKLTLSRDQWARAEKTQQQEGDGAGKWRRLSGNVRSRKIELDQKAPTLTSGYKNASSVSTRFIFEDKLRNPLPTPRFLSPRECCRVMGFPEEFIIPPEEKSGAHNLFYRQIGNAVCPPVIEAVGSLVVEQLARHSKLRTSS